MKKNIHANLDLTKSLSDFQETVTKLLELTNVKEWDGQNRGLAIAHFWTHPTKSHCSLWIMLRFHIKSYQLVVEPLKV